MKKKHNKNNRGIERSRRGIWRGRDGEGREQERLKENRRHCSEARERREKFSNLGQLDFCGNAGQGGVIFAIPSFYIPEICPKKKKERRDNKLKFTPNYRCFQLRNLGCFSSSKCHRLSYHCRNFRPLGPGWRSKAPFCIFPRFFFFSGSEMICGMNFPSLCIDNRHSSSMKEWRKKMLTRRNF